MSSNLNSADELLTQDFAFKPRQTVENAVPKQLIYSLPDVFRESDEAGGPSGSSTVIGSEPGREKPSCFILTRERVLAV